MDKFADLTGRKFGELTILGPTSERLNAKIVWLCQCSCGKQTTVPTHNLTSGNSTSCGHTRGRKKDLTGQRFGRLLVLEEAGRTPLKQVKWRCRCDCGKEIIAAAMNLASGGTRSCGCLQRDMAATCNTTHGLSGVRSYLNANERKRREKKRQLDIEWTVEMEIALVAFFPVCVVCGGTRRMSTDHVLPLASGNGLRPGNAVRLCMSCNRTKSNKPLDRLPADMREKIIQAAESFCKHWKNLQRS